MPRTTPGGERQRALVIIGAQGKLFQLLSADRVGGRGFSGAELAFFIAHGHRLGYFGSQDKFHHQRGARRQANLAGYARQPVGFGSGGINRGGQVPENEITGFIGYRVERCAGQIGVNQRQARAGQQFGTSGRITGGGANGALNGAGQPLRSDRDSSGKSQKKTSASANTETKLSL